jgi:hypothetical protein
MGGPEGGQFIIIISSVQRLTPLQSQIYHLSVRLATMIRNGAIHKTIRLVSVALYS